MLQSISWRLNDANRRCAAELKNVPLLISLATNAADRAVFEFVSLSGFVARPMATPPGTPAKINRMIDSAFNQTMKDPAFLADARRTKLPIDPFSAKQVWDRVEKVLSTPKDVIDRYVKIVGLQRKKK